MKPELQFSKRKRSQSLGWLAQIYFDEGPEAASRRLEEVFADEQPVVVEREGQPSARTDVLRDAERIKYRAFGPPALWQSPYSILQVSLDEVSARRPGRSLHVPRG